MNRQSPYDDQKVQHQVLAGDQLGHEHGEGRADDDGAAVALDQRAFGLEGN